MSNGLSLVVVVVLAIFIMVGGAFFLLLDQIDPQEKIDTNHDRIRQVAVTNLASTINHHFDQNHIDLISESWQQLGTGQEGCNLQTAHCQLENAQCLNLPEILSENISLPVDAEAPGLEKTGYAIRAINPQMVEIKACFTEAAAPIVQRVSVRSE